MPRPCNGCERPECAICKLYHENERYRAFWNDQPLPAMPTTLVHGVSETEARQLFPGVDDPSLLGNRIEALTKAVGIPTCGGCKSRQAWLNRAHKWIREAACVGSMYPTITTRNLIYHVAPLRKNEGWRHNVRSLLANADAFNGRRLIAVSTGDEMHSPEVVRQAFGDGPWEWLEMSNCADLREVVTFKPLLERIASTSPNEATFYAHTKGNSTGDDRLGALLWRKTMYHHLLGRWQDCMKELESHHFVGANKIVWWRGIRSPFPTFEKLDPIIGTYMLAGTFFWFRHDQTFAHPRWNDVPVDRYGAEAWPSIVCPDPTKAKSVFQPWPESQYPTPTPYDPRIYDRGLATKEELRDITDADSIVAAALEVDGLMGDIDLHRLVELSSSLPRNSVWIEVGSYAGRSLLATGLALEPGKLVTVDSGRGVDHEHPVTPAQSASWRAVTDRLATRHAVTRLETESAAAAAMVPNGVADAVFIDAGHAEEEVRSDINCWLPKLKLGGLLTGHDYGHCPDVTRVVDELFPGREVVGTVWSVKV